MLNLLYMDCSDIVEIKGKTITRDRDVLSVVGDLVCIHNCGWHLD